MRKKLFGALVVGGLSVALLTGCGNEKKLTCTMTSDTETDTQQYVFNQGGNKLKSVSYSLTAPYENDEAYETTEALCKTIEETMDKASCTISKSNNQATMRISIPVEGLTSQELKEYSLEDYTTYDDAKKRVEEEGYTCK